MSPRTAQGIADIQRKLRQLSHASVSKEWNIRFVFATQEAAK